jgi:hypothetical protein
MFDRSFYQKNRSRYENDNTLEDKIIKRAMIYGLESGITCDGGRMFVKPWNRHGNRELTSITHVARPVVIERLPREYARATMELRPWRNRVGDPALTPLAKAAMTRAANKSAKQLAEFGPVVHARLQIELKLRQAHEDAHIGIAPDPAIVDALTTIEQREFFAHIAAFALRRQRMFGQTSGHVE